MRRCAMQYMGFRGHRRSGIVVGNEINSLRSSLYIQMRGQTIESAWVEPFWMPKWVL